MNDQRWEALRGRFAGILRHMGGIRADASRIANTVGFIEGPDGSSDAYQLAPCTDAACEWCTIGRPAEFGAPAARVLPGSFRVPS